MAVMRGVRAVLSEKNLGIILGWGEMRRTACLDASGALQFKFTSGLEQALHPQREAHVARDAQLAAHESDLSVQLA